MILAAYFMTYRYNWVHERGRKRIKKIYWYKITCGEEKNGENIGMMCSY